MAKKPKKTTKLKTMIMLKLKGQSWADHKFGTSRAKHSNLTLKRSHQF